MLGDKHLVGAEKKVKAEPAWPSPGEEAGEKKEQKNLPMIIKVTTEM